MSESLGSSLCLICKNICLTSLTLDLQQIVTRAALGGSGDVGLICTILDTLLVWATPDFIICSTSSCVAFDSLLRCPRWLSQLPHR